MSDTFKLPDVQEALGRLSQFVTMGKLQGVDLSGMDHDIAAIGFKLKEQGQEITRLTAEVERLRKLFGALALRVLWLDESNPHKDHIVTLHDLAKEVRKALKKFTADFGDSIRHKAALKEAKDE